MVLEKQIYTLDDLLAMGEDARVEIIGGELVEMPAAGGLHQIVSGNDHLYRGSQTIDAEALFPGIEGLTTDAIFHLPEWIVVDDAGVE